MTEKIGRQAADALIGRICAAAGLAAQSDCRLLELIGEFDAVDGLRWWNDLKSLGHLLSWCCSMSPGTAREHVRVARALRQMPTLTAAFREGRLSYSKVREATRVVGLIDEVPLTEMALTATASQLARIVRGYRTASGARIKQQPDRALTWTEREDEMVDFRIRLPKEEAAVLISALEAAKGQFGAPPPEPDATPTYGYVDAMLDVATSFVDAVPEDRSGEDRTLVVVHVDAELLTGAASEGENVPAGTPAPPSGAGTCHLQRLGGIEAETAQRLACDAKLLGALVDADGQVLKLGRTRRLVSKAQRRALMIRDGMCQFPGCHQARHLKAHHRVSWAAGGLTDLDNLILLCQWHHTTVHEGQVRIEPAAETTPTRRWDFVAPDGRPVNGFSEERLTARLGGLVGKRRYLYEEYLDDVRSLQHRRAQRIVPGWRGEPFRLADCVTAMFGMRCTAPDGSRAA